MSEDPARERDQAANAVCAVERPAPGWSWRRVCSVAELTEGGDGVRFEVEGRSGPEAAFVVRSAGRPRAYLNRCRHVPVELDWLPGQFFDESGLYLVCSTHGAMYRASDGRCEGGPCGGRPLIALQVCESDGAVWVAVRDEE